MKIGCVADLHFGIDRWVDDRVRRFIDQRIAAAELDLLVVAGDVAESIELTGDQIGTRHQAVLQRLRQAVAGPVAFCAGNHDVWTSDPNVDSWTIYRDRLTEVAARTGTTYLDHDNLLLDDLAVVGCYGHFDFSLRTPGLEIHGEPVLEDHYRRQTPPGYPGPVWMDGVCIRWSWEDGQAAAEICRQGGERMRDALDHCDAILFASHGVPRNEVNGHYRGRNPVSLFLNAFSGTTGLEGIIRQAADRGARVLAVSGHTHKSVGKTRIDGVDYLNVGGTYGKLRLVEVVFPPEDETQDGRTSASS